MKAALFILLVTASVGRTQPGPDDCCKCDQRVSSTPKGDVVCLSAKNMRAHVDHIEPLRPSGLGKDLKLAGTVVLEVRFGPDGKVACARAKSGHPIAISAAMEAIQKWTFKPLAIKGVPTSGCGQIVIKYRLRDQGSTTELARKLGPTPGTGATDGIVLAGYAYDGTARLHS